MRRSMGAVVLHRAGDLRYELQDVPQVGPGDVLVRVMAAGVCGSDVHRLMIHETRVPIIPGHELAGEVWDCGPQVDNVSPGDRVTVIPILPCGDCSYCRLGQHSVCDSFGFLGSRNPGGFAEYVAVPKANVLPLPDNVDYEAGAFGEPASVALHSIRRAGGIRRGQDVVVSGSGTIGLLVAQLSRSLGAAKVILIDICDRKLGMAKGLGFEDCINPAGGASVRDRVMEMTDGAGADLVFEAAGENASIQQVLEVAGKQGTVVMLGNLWRDVVIPRQAAWGILRKELTVIGTWASPLATGPDGEWRLALKHISNGDLRVEPLITHRFPMDRAGEALKMMFDRSEFYCKVMLVPPARATS